MQCLARRLTKTTSNHSHYVNCRFYSTSDSGKKTTKKKINRLLCANRGEIATRVFRAATELGKTTVAIYAKEDAKSLHRSKADEAYLVGENKTPVGAYLAYEEIVKLAKSVDVDAIHPGYGFLSENANFARLCEENGITFVGPKSETLVAMGDKTAARKIAIACGVPVIPGSGAISKVEECKEFVAQYGFPIIIKAAFGGGGRGMRVVHKESDLEESFNRCRSEGESFFGDGTVFLERYIESPRHIEVQLLGDKYGNVIHLYDRDCSIQRRHQKVVEIAPATAVGLSKEKSEAICADALKIAHHVQYQNAGTAEFLVDKQGNHYFIEVNPRIQVEHTVTEEVTNVDLVASQIQIAEGKTLKELGLNKKHEPRGCAIQCRVTTEDPTNNFQPDTGRITTFRPGEGMGIRLDAGSGYAGFVVSPHYDSLLCKVTGHANDFNQVANKLNRALKEFRVRGVKTNIPFILKVLNHPEFRDCKLDTSFIERNPDLFDIDISKNRAEKLLQFLAHTKINGVASVHPGATGPAPLDTVPKTLIPDQFKLSEREKNTSHKPGWRNVLVKEGPAAFAKAIRKHPKFLFTDTTMRDAHQSLLATRVRTIDMLEIAPATAHYFSPLLSLENWGGATYDVAMRFLHECPWERLSQLRELIPNIPFQMLLRGANAVGYTSYPDNVVHKFCKLSVKNGMDIFRIFDSLNYMENLKLGIDAVGEAGGVVEASICYTGDVSDPKRGPYNLEYYLKFARELMKHNVHILNVKDMAGLLKPEAATILIGALRKEFPDVPIHVHTHDTAGTGVASMLAAFAAGADAVDAALDSMSGMTSQPSLGALVASLGDKTDLKLDELLILNNYWESVRGNYAPFESGQKSGCSDVYINEIPGGQYTNLLFQAQQLGLHDQWPAIKSSYALANRLLGDIIKVTPSSKVVGDLAQFLVQNNLTEEKQIIDQAEKLSFPSSVIEYFEGKIGIPTFGFPEPLRTKVLGKRPALPGRPGASMAPYDFDSAKKKLAKQFDKQVTEEDVINYALYPKVTEEFLTFQKTYGDVSVIPTSKFFAPLKQDEEVEIEIERGKKLLVRLSAVGDTLNDKGEREAFFELNGTPRTLLIPDMEATKVIVQREKATSAPGSIGAPMPGVVVNINVAVGDKVSVGDSLCVLSAMKMETVVTAPIDGVVRRIAIVVGDNTKAGDLLVEISDK
eukprot:TRINITY_DN6264_c0_g1_i1.p1 TRINITY_DN6264_c0_g1~~TRINITY_DN6264_c0_g1_i1.p1  ORF type:complete len:1189 (-),score=354.24 TRINITY_DN6264_c0_g1_i1:162-3728(-)